MKKLGGRISPESERILGIGKEKRIIPVNEVKRKLCPEVMDRRSLTKSITALSEAGLLDVRQVVGEGGKLEKCLIFLRNIRRRKRVRKRTSFCFVHCTKCNRLTKQKMVDQRRMCVPPKTCDDFINNPPIVLMLYKCRDCGEVNSEIAPTYFYGKIGRDSSA